MGARLLFIRTNMEIEAKCFFKEALRAEEVDFQTGMAKATENSCLIFITDTYSEGTNVGDAQAILLTDLPASICLSIIINNNASRLINRVDMGPSLIIMRIAGNKNIIEEQMLETYGGKTLPLEEAINQGERDDSILVLTHQQLIGALTGDEFLHNLLLLPHPAPVIFEKLRSEGILFITRSLDKRKWFELRINIYDVQGRYEIHYERLILAINNLGLGMILEEGWTRDHALILLSITTYQIRLFTFFEPEEIKEVLLGLEYSPEGKRWVDFDLYYRNRKISWTDVNKGKKKFNKIERALYQREIILDRLTAKGKDRLLELEEKI